MKHLFYLVLLAMASVITSCGGDDGVEDCTQASLNFSQEFSDELLDITNAATNYANDQSSSNCNAYKNAVRDYVNALKSIKDCAQEAGQLAEYNAALNQYESQIDNLC